MKKILFFLSFTLSASEGGRMIVISGPVCSGKSELGTKLEALCTERKIPVKRYPEHDPFHKTVVEIPDPEKSNRISQESEKSLIPHSVAVLHLWYEQLQSTLTAYYQDAFNVVKEGKVVILEQSFDHRDFFSFFLEQWQKAGRPPTFMVKTQCPPAVALERFAKENPRFHRKFGPLWNPVKVHYGMLDIIYGEKEYDVACNINTDCVQVVSQALLTSRLKPTAIEHNYQLYKGQLKSSEKGST